MVTKSRSLTKLVFGGALSLLSLSAHAGVADSNCCTSGSSCAAMINQLQASCAQGNASLSDTCKAFDGLVRYDWLLQNENFTPLSSSLKDIAGTYRLDMNKFVLVNKWLRGDADGISKNGSSETSLKKICYSSRDVVFSGVVGSFIFKTSFQLSFRTDVRNAGGKRGYFVEGGGGNQRGSFFFSPVSANRTPLDVL